MKGKKSEKVASQGFSMVDLLIASVILAVLIGATVTLINPIGQLKKARDSQRRSELNEYRIGIEAYAASNNGVYPVHEGSPVRADQDPDNPDLCEDLRNSVDFVDACPADPLNATVGGEGYFYYYQSNASGQDAVLAANLERGDFWAICTTGKSGETNNPIVFCGI